MITCRDAISICGSGSDIAAGEDYVTIGGVDGVTIGAGGFDFSAIYGDGIRADDAAAIQGGAGDDATVNGDVFAIDDAAGFGVAGKLSSVEVEGISFDD